MALECQVEAAILEPTKLNKEVTLHMHKDTHIPFVNPP